MGISMKKFIDKHLGSLKSSKVKKISLELRHKLYSKDRDIISWSGSPLQGVHRISYTDKDLDAIFVSFGVDKFSFKKDIPNITGINPEFRVSTTPEYVLLVSIMIKIIKDKVDDEATLKNLHLIFSFRVTTSAYSNYYSYLVEEKTARLVYDRLSKKFLIKKLGSNFRVLDYKTQYIFEGTKNYKYLQKGGIDEAVLVMNSISNSIRQFIHSGFLALLEVNESNDSVSTTTTLNKEGESISIANNTRVYYESIERILYNKDLLIDTGVITLISEVTNTNTSEVPRVLEYIHESLKTDARESIKLVNKIVTGTLYYLYQNDFYPPYGRDIKTLIQYLKNYWSNSKVKNPDVLAAKQIVRTFMIKGLKMKAGPLINGTAIIVTVYLFLMGVIQTKK